ncbi:MAG TPA: hypothetical protein VNM67_09610 [Thermoanaerobaculia bacterium]|jgi:hypothetical protein|nr:hypothetical protein [Thermoanaerobaculia bacterium]
MPSNTLDVLGRGFRANPSFELVLFDRLEPRERETLADLRKDPDFYGILRPREASTTLGIKSVDRETALLFLTLREPGALPSYMRTMLGDGVLRVVARLVADAILEVEETPGEPRFISGAPALALFGERRSGQNGAGGRLAEISLAALRYAQDLAEDDPLALSFRLYGYNRRPLTPVWKRLLPKGDQVLAWLGVGPGGPRRSLLDRSWERTGGSAEWWLSWRSRQDGDLSGGSGGGATWKLYISPVPEALPESFGDIIEALTAAKAAQFKVGADALGILRADKIVSYFPSFERLAAAAEALEARLSGIPAQGVPFTSEIGGGGLLSWGVDPPREETSFGGGESWRLWLTHRLSRALLSARSEPEPWRFALERVRLEGVDTDTWTPGALLWKRS